MSSSCEPNIGQALATHSLFTTAQTKSSNKYLHLKPLSKDSGSHGQVSASLLTGYSSVLSQRFRPSAGFPSGSALPLVRGAFEGPMPRHIGVWIAQAHTVVVLPLRGSFQGYLPSLRSGLTSQSGARAGSSLRSI